MTVARSCSTTPAVVEEGVGGGNRDGGVVVVRTQCAEDLDCDSGVYCDGRETCSEGLCAAGEVVACDDGIDCTRDRCSEATMGCRFTAPDADGDGHLDDACEDADGEPLGDDCDDDDSSRFPGNIEVCEADGHDEDCDGATLGQRDQDLDTFLDVSCCNGDVCGQDCDDQRAGTHPDVPEVCDGLDNDCDGIVDEELREMRFVDADGDGAGKQGAQETAVCPGVKGFVAMADDCDDDDPFANPRIYELCADNVDNDCDGIVDEAGPPATWYLDGAGDRYGDTNAEIRTSCERQAGYALYVADCDDRNASINPGAEERCNGLDDDCNGQADYIISSGDGEDDDGDGSADFRCEVASFDCNDEDADTYPGAPELCDGVDNDCNGVVDTLTTDLAWYVDRDHDGYGDPLATVVTSCERVPNRVRMGGDCDDDNDAMNPGRVDDCSGLSGQDDDCDGKVDEGTNLVAYYRDTDGDGFGSGAPTSGCAPPANFTALGGDCNEGDAAISPAATEVCTPGDGIDQNCDVRASTPSSSPPMPSPELAGMGAPEHTLKKASHSSICAVFPVHSPLGAVLAPTCSQLTRSIWSRAAAAKQPSACATVALHSAKSLAPHTSDSSTGCCRHSTMMDSHACAWTEASPSGGIADSVRTAWSMHASRLASWSDSPKSPRLWASHNCFHSSLSNELRAPSPSIATRHPVSRTRRARAR